MTTIIKENEAEISTELAELLQRASDESIKEHDLFLLGVSGNIPIIS